MPNIQFQCPHCHHAIETPVDMLGQLMDCPSCNETVEVQPSPAKPPLAPRVPPRTVPALKLPRPPQLPRKAARGKEYKVLTQTDKWFAGTFTPEKLEQALNAYAAQGWRVISVTTVHLPSAPEGHREELIAVLGRDA